MHTRQTYPDKLRQFNGYKDMKTSCQTQEVQTLRKGNPLKEEDIFCKNDRREESEWKKALAFIRPRTISYKILHTLRQAIILTQTVWLFIIGSRMTKRRRQRRKRHGSVGQVGESKPFACYSEKLLVNGLYTKGLTIYPIHV